MAIPAKYANSIFRKTKRGLVQISGSEPGADALHSFRTTTRRLETLLTQILPGGGRNERKLLKMLDRIRRRVGKIRDLDVQLTSLRTLKISQEPRRKTQLIQRLIELRVQHENKLRKLITKSEIHEIDKRLKKSSKRVDLRGARDPLAVAKQILGSAKLPAASVSEEALHRFRTAVKRARYAAEFAPKSAESAAFIEQLKQMQDALGNWHDWLMVTQAAEENLGEVTHSSLVAALRNLTRGKYREALVAVSNQRAVSASMPRIAPYKTRSSADDRQSDVAA